MKESPHGYLLGGCKKIYKSLPEQNGNTLSYTMFTAFLFYTGGCKQVFFFFNYIENGILMCGG